MPDIAKAYAAVRSILALPTINKNVRYYAEVALLHLQPEKEHGTDGEAKDRPRGQDDGKPHRGAGGRIP